MSRTRPHTTHHSRAPRAHRDAMPMHVSRHGMREAWRARTAETVFFKPESVDAQTIFYIARGVAALLAAVAVGLGAASNDAQQAGAAYPTSSHATTR